LGSLFGLCPAVGILFLDPRAVRLEHFAVGVVGAQRLLARQQVVARKAVLDLHHIADGAELLDAFKQDHFHGSFSLLHDVGKQADVASALDGARELALLLGRDGGDARRDDLAALRDEALEQAHVLVIDLRRVLAREGAGLAAAEKRAGHYSTSSSRARKLGRSSRSPRSPRSPRGPRSRSLSPRRIIADGPFSSSSTRMLRKRITSSLMFDWRSSSAIAAAGASRSRAT